MTASGGRGTRRLPTEDPGAPALRPTGGDVGDEARIAARAAAGSPIAAAEGRADRDDDGTADRRNEDEIENDRENDRDSDEGGGDATQDTLLRGRIHLFQPRRGFRSSLDPLLLAAFVPPPIGRFVDIGCGTGALAFLLADKDPRAHGVGIEIQRRLAALARRGNQRNGFAARIDIVTADVRATSTWPQGLASRAAASAFDCVVINPPFRSASGGVLSPHPERAQANHELTLALDEWLRCAAWLLRPGGRLAAIYPADRLVALVAGCAARSLTPCRLRMVHPRADRPASRVLLEARAHGRQTLQVEPPLVLHADTGVFAPEVREMLGQDREL